MLFKGIIIGYVGDQVYTVVECVNGKPTDRIMSDNILL